MERKPKNRVEQSEPDVRPEFGRLVMHGLSDMPSRSDVERLLAQNDQWQHMRASVQAAFEVILDCDDSIKKTAERDKIFENARGWGLPEQLIRDAYIDAINKLNRPLTVSDDLPPISRFNRQK